MHSRGWFGGFEVSQFKYTFTDETLAYKGVSLRRIRAARDIGSKFDGVIMSGDLGGWIQSEENLAHSGNC